MEEDVTIPENLVDFMVELLIICTKKIRGFKWKEFLDNYLEDKGDSDYVSADEFI